MLAQARIFVFVQRRSVERSQPMRVLGKVRRNPVHDYADAGLMAAIDEVHEILRRPEARRRREVPRHLIAPRRRIRMLGDRHQLDMRVAHLLHVCDQLFAPVGGTLAADCFHPSHPRSQMHFVDGHRAVQHVRFAALLHPCLVVPLYA